MVVENIRTKNYLFIKKIDKKVLNLRHSAGLYSTAACSGYGIVVMNGSNGIILLYSRLQNKREVFNNFGH